MSVAGLTCFNSGDVAKQLPTAVEVLRKVLHIARSTRDHVARLRIIAGKSTTKLVIPTATRWNSQTRSAARKREVQRVERSFQREGVIWSAKRNRMSATSVDDQLFVALNYPKLRLKESREPQDIRLHKEDVSKELWQRTLASMTELMVRPPRPQRIKNHVDQLALGKRIEVQWRLPENGRMQFFKGTVVKINDRQLHEYEVFWDEGELLTTFKPLTADTVWRFIGLKGYGYRMKVNCT
jgi:hypothetical protein